MVLATVWLIEVSLVVEMISTPCLMSSVFVLLCQASVRLRFMGCFHGDIAISPRLCSSFLTLSCVCFHLIFCAGGAQGLERNGS